MYSVCVISTVYFLPDLVQALLAECLKMTHVLAGNLFLSLLLCDIIDNSVPWGLDSWSQPSDLQWHGRAIANGGLPKGKLLQCQFQPSSDFCFISSQVTAVKLKRYSKLTAQFCFSLLVHLQFDWCDMFFLHDWISMVGDGHL